MNEHVALSGNLAFLPFGDLIQLLGSNGSTGVLRLASQWVQEAGFVYFSEGNPVNAQNGSVDGLEALNSLFGWVDGNFEFTPGPIMVEKKITKSRMGIILEGMKLLDDGHIEKVGGAARSETPALRHLRNQRKSPWSKVPWWTTCTWSTRRTFSTENTSSRRASTAVGCG